MAENKPQSNEDIELTPGSDRNLSPEGGQTPEISVESVRDSIGIYLAKQVRYLKDKADSEYGYERLAETYRLIEEIYAPRAQEQPRLPRQKPEKEKSEKWLEEFDRKALDFIEKYMGMSATTPQCLCGLDSEKSWQLRKALLENSGDLDFVALGLAGIDSDRAWLIRDVAMKDPNLVSKGWVVAGLAGLDSDRAWKMREDFFANENTDMGSLALSLVGLDSERAWQMREALLAWVQSEEFSKKLKNGVMGFATLKDYISKLKGDIAESLASLDSDRAWKMRQTLSESGARERGLLRSLVCLDSEKAWEAREIFLKEYGEAVAADIAQSLAGLDSDRAWEMRQRLLDKYLIYKDDKDWVAAGLAGLDSKKAWEMRERILKEGGRNKYAWVAFGLSGDYTTFVWRLLAKKRKQ